jgi:hypothetical protein
MRDDRAWEIYERNKQRNAKPKKERKLSVREWLLALFAFVGLLLTAITTYYATIRTIDEVRVVVNDVPRIAWDNSQISVEPKLSLTFVNSGNRSAAITAIFIHLRRTHTCDEKERYGGSTYLEFLSEPFVIKPNEILEKSLQYLRERSFDLGEVFKTNHSAAGLLGGLRVDIVPKSKQVIPPPDDMVAICLGVSYVTPNAHSSSKVLISSFDTSGSWYQQAPYNRYGLDTAKAWVIVRETGSVFGIVDATPKMTEPLFRDLQKAPWRTQQIN